MTRANVHYVVTEHGVAYLYGKTLRERAHLDRHRYARPSGDA
jgi:acyl-CoA hydrolase